MCLTIVVELLAYWKLRKLLVIVVLRGSSICRYAMVLWNRRVDVKRASGPDPTAMPSRGVKAFGFF